MSSPEPDFDPQSTQGFGLAMEWVTRITAVALEMVLPGLAGQWLDQRFGTQFLTLLGFVFGISAAMWHLIAMTRPAKPRS